MAISLGQALPPTPNVNNNSCHRLIFTIEFSSVTLWNSDSDTVWFVPFLCILYLFYVFSIYKFVYCKQQRGIPSVIDFSCSHYALDAMFDAKLKYLQGIVQQILEQYCAVPLVGLPREKIIGTFFIELLNDYAYSQKYLKLVCINRTYVFRALQRFKGAQSYSNI